MNPLVCIDCHVPLESGDHYLRCESCGSSYPVHDRVADFSCGAYYDSFDPERDVLTEAHARGLELELEGTVRRIDDFYIPLIHRVAAGANRILDAGCGNGVSVDRLRRAGYDAWGNDLSQLRQFQWRERTHRENLVVASALSLPFLNAYFDVVISSGVIEHIGTIETAPPFYSARAVANQRELRVAYLSELGRVLKPGGHIFVDCPNGAFPVDFWHGNAPGSPRFHRRSEQFLPTFREIRALAQAAMQGSRVRAHSPRGRLQFKQSATHMHGRIFRAPLSLAFSLMERRPFSWLARTAANPFLVVQISKP